MLKAVWRGRIEWFWLIWITITGTAAIGVAWVVGHAATPMAQMAKEAPINRVQRYGWSRGAVAALTLLALILVGYIVASLMWEDFANYDDAYFTLFTLKGQNLWPPIWRENGRFFPLGHQEFNLIRHFTDSVAGYHALPIAQLLIVSCILLILDGELNITARAALTAFVLILPAFVTSFTGLVFPERNVVFWLAWLLLFVKRFEQTRSTAWAVGAAVSAQIMIYYKETAFLLLLGFAVGRLILRCRRADRAGWDYSRLRDKESRLDLCFISLGVLFWLYYVAVMIPHPNMQYADQQRFPLGKVFLYYIEHDLLAWLFVGVVLRRAYRILRRRVAPLPLWDGLAFGGAVCLTAYLYLGLSHDYYLAPMDLIAVVYVGRFAILSWGKMRLWRRAAALVLGFAVLLQGVSLSAFRVFERKNVIHAKAEIADVIAARYQSGARNAQRLFFPFANVYLVTEFASYLNYRGVPVEGAAVESAAPNGVVIVSKTAAKDGPCVYYRSFVCHAGSRPDPGDLVIELPEEDESLAETGPYRKGGELLFSYEPRPRIPHWLYPFVSRLSFASVCPVWIKDKELPDRWLHASVTAWK